MTHEPLRLGLGFGFRVDSTRRSPSVNRSIVPSWLSAAMSGFAATSDLREAFFSTFAATPSR